MSNANALARGLVSFLDLTTQGRGPDTLLGSIQAVIDLSDFISLNKRERVLLGGVSFSANGQNNFGGGGAVPSNEAWLIVAYTVSASRNAADNFQLQPTVQMPIAGGTQSFALGPYVTAASAALGGTIFAPAEQVNLWVPPGTIFGFNVESYAAAAARTAFGALDFTRVRL